MGLLNMSPRARLPVVAKVAWRAPAPYVPAAALRMFGSAGLSPALLPCPSVVGFRAAARPKVGAASFFANVLARHPPALGKDAASFRPAVEPKAPPKTDGG